MHSRSLYTNADGSMKRAGDVVKMRKLAATYRSIALGGADVFYNGTLKDEIVADLTVIGTKHGLIWFISMSTLP